VHFKLRPASGAGPAGSIDLGEQVDVNLNLATNRHNKKAGSGQYFRVCSIKRRHLFRASRCQDRNPGASFTGRRSIKNYKRLQFFFYIRFNSGAADVMKIFTSAPPPESFTVGSIRCELGETEKINKGAVTESVLALQVLN
jgi:hypothetical protein